jgi:xylulose-5-phosphate/fructose-6-phosphate phosphoketolase
VAFRPRWPKIVLRAPKGWTGPKEIRGHKVEGSWRSHHVPFFDVRDNPANLKLLEDWMRSYKPEDLFDADVKLVPKLRNRAAHLKEEMKNAIIDNLHYAHGHGSDREEISNWTWPY